MTRELTGRHAALIFGSFFGVIITVNIVLATQAVRTFPGLEVKNSYVASQSFDRNRAAQEALGWTTDAHIEGDSVILSIEDKRGYPAPVEITSARLGRKTYAAEDRALTFTPDGDRLVADAPDLPGGGWTLWLTANAPDGTLYFKRLSVRAAP